MSWSLRAAACAALAPCLVPAASWAGTIEVFYDRPALDRWMYPFNPTPGTRSFSSTFGSFQDPRFDNRDGQMIVGFDTSADVPSGLGPDAYEVIRVRLVLENTEDLVFRYDDTQDPYTAFLDPGDPEYVEDADPGQPIELFGTGFRGGLDTLSFQEDTPYTFGDPIGQGIRNAWALGHDGGGAPIDVSLSVLERYDPRPWAIGIIPGLEPGELVPIRSEIVFDLDVGDPDVQGYLREAMHLGMLDLCVTSLTFVKKMGGTFPTYYNKESELVELGIADAAQLELEVRVDDPCPEDLDGSGAVDFADVLAVLSAWGECPGCPEDLDGSGVVDFADVLIILTAWGPCAA